MLLYFTSGTTSRPKLVEHSHQSYPVGHLITMYWIGLRPGDMHLNISSPGWAKHAYSCFFAPWNAGATVFIANQPRFNARGMLDAIAQNNVTTICAPPTVWRMFVQEDMASWTDVAARGLFGRRTAQSGDHRARAEGLGADGARGLRPDRDHACRSAASPASAVKPGSMGQEAPGYRIRLLDADDKDVEEGEVCIDSRSGTRRSDARLPER